MKVAITIEFSEYQRKAVAGFGNPPASREVLKNFVDMCVLGTLEDKEFDYRRDAGEEDEE